MWKTLFNLLFSLILAGFSHTALAQYNGPCSFGSYQAFCPDHGSCVGAASYYGLGYTVDETYQMSGSLSHPMRDGVWSNNTQCYVPVPACDDGFIKNMSNQCVPWCPTNHSLEATDPACVACGAGQMKYEGNCVPDCASRSGETGEGDFLVCTPPTGAPVVGSPGCPSAAGFMSAGGSDQGCILNFTGNSDCYRIPSSGEVYCTMTYTVTSTKVPMSDPVEGVPAAPVPNVKDKTPAPPEDKVSDPLQEAPPSCGPGYTLSGGLCVSSTAPENNPPKCPIGYIQSGPNSCVSPDMAIKCAAGYTLNAALKCESLADLAQVKKNSTNSCGGVGQPACKTVLVDGAGNAINMSQCGGVGQPACKYLAVDENGVPVTHCGGVGQPRCGTQLTDENGNALFFTRDAGADATAAGSLTTEMGKAALAVTDASTQEVSHGWTLGLATIFPQSAQCSAWVFNVGGGTQTIDPCPTADKIRSIAEFALYVITVFALFRILFGARGAVRA